MLLLPYLDIDRNLKSNPTLIGPELLRTSLPYGFVSAGMKMMKEFHLVAEVFCEIASLSLLELWALMGSNAAPQDIAKLKYDRDYEAKIRAHVAVRLKNRVSFSTMLKNRAQKMKSSPQLALASQKRDLR